METNGLLDGVTMRFYKNENGFTANIIATTLTAYLNLVADMSSSSSPANLETIVDSADYNYKQLVSAQ